MFVKPWSVAAVACVCLVGVSCSPSSPPQQSATASGQATTSASPAPAGDPAQGAAQPTSAAAGVADQAAQAPAPTQPPSGVADSFDPRDTGAPPAAPVAPSAPPPPPPPPEPEFREYTVPAGTALSVVLDTGVNSGTSAVEDTVRGHLANSVRLDGVKVLPAGSTIVGTVVEAQGAGKVKGRGRVAFRFDRITAHGEQHPARTSAYTAQARATKGKDAKKIGIGAGAGAIIGGIIGGGKGAAIGAGVGGGAGAGVVMATKGEEAVVHAGAQVRVTLQEPVTVRIPVEPKGAQNRP